MKLNNEQECYSVYNIDITKILNLSYIEKKANEHSDKRMTLVIAELALEQNFFSYLKNYSIRDYLMLFIQQPGDLNEIIHTDYVTETQPHHYSFNIICQGYGKMTWFKRPEVGSKLSRHPNDPERIIYETYKGLTLEPVSVWDGHNGNTALVRTGIPHGVMNDGDEQRICLSIRIDDYGWTGAKDIFNNYFLSNQINQ